MLQDELVILFYFIHMSELKNSSYLLSDQLNQAKCVFFTLLRILHHGQSATTCE